ncbi:MAG TPA: hypothetical protein VN704_06675 [Verrucomicrobiae bacterium]|nr:hypothetical protein [Verrucomicrobiae bacterium]
MSYSITVSVDNDNYIFKKQGIKILVNGKEIDTRLNYKDHKKEDLNEEESEILEYYREMIREGRDEKYARVKSSLFFASYIDEGSPCVNEFLDTIVLYLSGALENFPALQKNLKIVIKDEYIYTKEGEELSFPMTGSSLVDFDFEELLLSFL